MNADELLARAPALQQITEAERIDTISRLGMSQTATVATFAALIDALSLLLDLQSAFIVIDEPDHLLIWKSGDADVISRLPGRRSFSLDAVRTGRSSVILDVHRDPRFSDHPYVAGRSDPVRLYVGIPVKTSSGAIVASLDGFDTRERGAPDPALIAALEQLAATAIAGIELKAANGDLARQGAALSCRTELLEAIFDSVTEGVTAFDHDLNMLALNRKGAAILDLPADTRPDEFDFGKAFVRWAHAGFYGEGNPEELARMRVLELRARCRSDDRSTVEEWDVVLRDGRTIKRRMAPMRDGFLTTYRDISDERRRQSELAQQGRYFELQHGIASLANLAPDLSSALREFVEFNTRELKGVLGHVWIKTGQDLVSTGIIHLAERSSLTPAEIVSLKTELRRPSRLAVEAVSTREMRYASDGPDLGDLAAWCDPAAARTGYAVALGILEDVYVCEFYGPAGIGPKSWHAILVKDLEMQLSRVAERERSQCRKNEFISTISHELRTPLTSMRGMFELVGSELFGPLPEEASALIAEAGTVSRVLGTRIEDVLAIHDIQHGDVTPKLTRWDLAALVSELAAARGCDVAVDAEPHLDVVADRTFVTRAVDKLLTQAMEAADPVVPLRIRVAQAAPRVAVTIAFSAAAGADPDAAAGSVGVQLAACLLERTGGRFSCEVVGEAIAFRSDLPMATTRPGTRTELPARPCAAPGSPVSRPEPILA